MVGHRRDAWAYSQSKSYWGRKPWAPDPCFRENVMYTGHLLQLLALYETLTGDTRYWTDGWDFVWTDGRRVQYTVRRLIDGWSLLWYEPWAEDRGAALALWREAAARIDWTALETGEDAPAGAPSCRDPAPVPPVAASTFLAAAARACDDPETARRLERLSDRALVRRDGMIYLDVGREWRIGATANRILSLALRPAVEREPRYDVRRPDAPLAPGSRGRRSKVAIDIAGAFW